MSKTQVKPRVVDTVERVKKPSTKQDFSNEYIDKRVKIKLADSSIIEGVLLESSKYWFKIRGSSVIYVNKAWVISVEPL